MPTLQIRPRIDSDLAALSSVLKDVQAKTGYPVEGLTDPVKFLTPPGSRQAWVAVCISDSEDDKTREEVIVGHAMLTELVVDNDQGVTENKHMNEKKDGLIKAWEDHGGDPAKTVVFSRMFVHETYTGKGLGKRLFATALEAASDPRDKRRVVILVLTKNREAIRLYEKIGCEKIGESVYQTKLGKEYGAWYYAVPEKVEFPY